MKKLLILSIALFAIVACSKSDDSDEVIITTLEGSEFTLSQFAVHTFPAVDTWVIEDQSATAEDFAGLSAAIEYISSAEVDRKIEIEFSSLSTIPDYAIFGISLSDASRNFSALGALTAPNVTSVGNRAFEYCSGLTSVDMEILQSIGYNAFNGCSALTEIDLQEVTTIGESTFSGCSALTSVDLSALESLGSKAFNLCSSLEEATLPATLETIKESTFSYCTSLTSISAPAVVVIEQRAFNECRALTAFDAPLAEEIGDYAFIACESLESITLPSSRPSVGTGAFNHCTSLTEIISESSEFLFEDGILYNGDQSEAIAALQAVVSGDVVLPSSTTTLRERTFYNCADITSVDLPGVTSISSFAFGYCSSLLTATLGAATTLDSEAFYDCQLMTSLTAAYLTEIGSKAFYNCESLVELNIATASNVVLNSINEHAFYAADVSKIVLTLGAANASSVKYGDTLTLGDEDSIEFSEIIVLED